MWISFRLEFINSLDILAAQFSASPEILIGDVTWVGHHKRKFELRRRNLSG
jgi:hypothetical protein